MPHMITKEESVQRFPISFQPNFGDTSKHDVDTKFVAVIVQ